MSRTVTPVPKFILDMVPAPTGKNETVKSGNEDVMADTMPLIKQKIKRTLHHTKRLAAYLKGKTTEETLRNDANLILRHIKYVKDATGKEQIRSPRRLLHEGKGDCDCFVVFLSSLLTNQNIPHALRVIKQHDDAWSHIYIVVPNVNGKQVTLDCVTDKFDSEPYYSEKKDFNMALEYLDGVQGLPTKPVGLGRMGGLADCKPKQAEPFKPLIRYYDTQALINQGYVPTVDMIKENNLTADYVENAEGVGSFNVDTPTGVKTLPTVLTQAEADQFIAETKNPVVEQEKILTASTDIKPLVKPATLGWVALATLAVTLLWPSVPKPTVPAPKLSGVGAVGSHKKNKIQTFTI